MTPNASVVLAGDLGIEHAGALHAQLAPHLEAEKVEISGAVVGRVHTATLQVLASFVHTRRVANRATTWSGASPILADGVSRLGLNSLMGLDAPSGKGASP